MIICIKNCEYDLCAKETRLVRCSDLNSICNINQKPISEKSCILPENITCGIWKIESWSEVSQLSNKS
jgi:hypothetical protein